MPMHHIQLTDEDHQFIEEQVASGFYHSPSDVLGAGLRLLERQAQSDREKLAVLRSLAEEAFADLDAGNGIHFENEEEIADWFRRIEEEIDSTVPPQPRDV